MSGFVFDQGNLNTAALVVPGAYVQLMTPTGLAVPGPSNAIAIAGTASWGPKNTPILCGELTTAQSNFGQFSADLFASDQYDMMRAAMQSYGEAQTKVSLNIWLSRVTDGTDAAASVTLKDTTSGSALDGMTIPAKWTGIGGNTIQCTIAAAGPANLYNVTFTGSMGGQSYAEFYTNIPGAASGASPFWVNLKNAILSGTSGRGPSQILGTPTSVSSSALNPAVGTFTLAGGTDGRGITSSGFFGSDVIGNRQGIYAFRGLKIVPAYVYCAGLADTTKFASIQSFCTQEIIRALLPLASGTSTSAAVTARSTLGISNKRVMYAKDWIDWVDPISGKVLRTDPVAVLIGRAASLSPELSPLNKQIYSVVGTERQGPYTSDEIGQLNQNGIWAIANPSIGGDYFGIISANTTSLNPIEQPVEYQRVKDYIGLSFASILGKYVGEKQGLFDPDATRAACKADIDSFMQLLKIGGIIVDWKSQCDERNNTPLSIQAGYLRARLEYIPYNSVKFVLLDIATVVSFSPAQAFASAA